jgi:hypothetical protein
VPYHRLTWTDASGKRKERNIKLDWEGDLQKLDVEYWAAEAGRHPAQQKPAKHTWAECIREWRGDARIQMNALGQHQEVVQSGVREDTRKKRQQADVFNDQVSHSEKTQRHVSDAKGSRLDVASRFHSLELRKKQAGLAAWR